MKLLIILVSFTNKELIIKLGERTVNNYRDTILENINLSTIIKVIDRELKESKYNDVFNVVYHDIYNDLYHDIKPSNINIEYKIKKWMKDTNADECIIDLTDITIYQKKKYNNFITSTFSSYRLLYSIY